MIGNHDDPNHNQTPSYADLEELLADLSRKLNQLQTDLEALIELQELAHPEVIADLEKTRAIPTEPLPY